MSAFGLRQELERRRAGDRRPDLQRLSEILPSTLLALADRSPCTDSARQLRELARQLGQAPRARPWTIRIRPGRPL